MSMEGQISNSHLAVTLPQILREILSFISTTDLVDNMTFVSRGWEEAARKHLLSRNLIQLDPSIMESYMEQTSVRGNHHKRVLLSTFNFTDLPPHESQLLENFYQNTTLPITELHLNYFPRGKHMVAAILKNFPNLTFLRLRSKDFGTQGVETFTKFPELTSFPKLAKLSLDMTSEKHENLVSTHCMESNLEIVSLFPNLKILQCGNLPKNVVEYFLSKNNNTCLESISIRFDTPAPISILNPSVFLTRIEFQIHVSSYPTDYDLILATFAGSVEKLQITGLRYISHSSTSAMEMVTITLPAVLPRLKFLKINLSRDSLGVGRNVKFPSVHLKFCERRVYSETFPVLEKLDVSELNKFEMHFVEDDFSDGEWFEICAEFLFKYFLFGECFTLRELHIPLNPKYTKNFRIPAWSQNYEEKCDFGVVDCSNFFDKIVATFPNLNPRWEAFGANGNLKEWLRMGRELGLRVTSGDRNSGEEDAVRDLLDLQAGKSCTVYVMKI
ncbi:hypothetical protein Fcan01_15794 [Folsomia candida]|uniref:F-box domain-containing protein n=1 Tax=Folsomia candida TaxID=158441 RepID=A0A226DVF5_FOLCA|nr:hypothetical protein Fcan01_15794 [Folsomia candida]